MNLFGVGALEILIILMVAFIVLGPDRLIGVARKLGTSMRELRNTTSEFSRILEEDVTTRVVPAPDSVPRLGLALPRRADRSPALSKGFFVW